MDYLDRRRAGLLRRAGAAAGRDRLLALARPPRACWATWSTAARDSLATLRRLRGLGNAATCLLGNHDLHLLAVAHGVRKPHRSDTLGDILRRARPRRLARLAAPAAAGACSTHGWLMRARRRGAAVGRGRRRWRWPARCEALLRGPDLPRLPAA